MAPATARMPLLALAVLIVLRGASRTLAGTLLLLSIAVAIYDVVLALFLASDTFLSLVIFMPEAVAGWGFPMAMLTYNGGQGLLALGAVIAMRALSARTADTRETAAATTA